MFVDHVALGVVKQLAHRHRLNRHRDDLLACVAVVISAVQVKPGRTSGIWPSIVTVTLKFVAVRVVPAPAAWIGLLPISVTGR